MDPKQAVTIILTAAGALTVLPVEAKPSTSTPRAVSSASSSAAPTPGSTDRANLEVAAHRLSALYGIIVSPGFGGGTFEEKAKLATELHQALALMATPEGAKVAKENGLTEAKLKEVKNSLDKWDAAMAALTTRTVQFIQPLYGILVGKQAAGSDLPKMQAMSNELHDALVVLRTPAGVKAAGEAKLTEQQLREVIAALVRLDNAIATLRAKTK